MAESDLTVAYVYRRECCTGHGMRSFQAYRSGEGTLLEDRLCVRRDRIEYADLGSVA